MAGALVLLTGLEGCGSILHHSGWTEIFGHRTWSERVDVYGGVELDVVGLAGLASTPLGVVCSPLWLPFVLVDFPLSGLCDTLALPVVLPAVHDRRARAEHEAAEDARRRRMRDAAPPAAQVESPTPAEAPRPRSHLDPAGAPEAWARVLGPEAAPAQAVDARGPPADSVLSSCDTTLVRARAGDVGPGSTWAAVTTSATGRLRLVAVDGLREAWTGAPAMRDLPVVLGAAVAPTGSLALVARRGRVSRFTAAEGEDLLHLPLVGGGPGDRIVGVALSADARVALASELRGGTVFAGTPGRLGTPLPGQVLGAYALALDGQGTRAAAGGWDGLVRLWVGGPTGWAAPRRLRAPTIDVAWASALRFTDDGALLAGYANGRVVRFEDERAKVVATEDGPVLALATTRDGDLLAASVSGTVSVRDLATGGLRLTLTGHLDLVVDLATSPDGGRAASASFDGTARVWDLATGRELDRIDLGPIGDAPRAVTFGDGEGGDGLVVATRDGLVLRYSAR